MDNRLLFYRENQKEIPGICHGILPEKLRSAKDYVLINRSIYRELQKRDAHRLCREWVNSRGVIVRFTRSCLEIKAIDEQDCIKSDMCIAAFINALMRSDISPEDDEDFLKEMTALAIRTGTARMKPELEEIYRKAERCATSEENAYLSIIKERIDNGSLAEVLMRRYRQMSLYEIMRDAEAALRMNISLA